MRKAKPSESDESGERSGARRYLNPEGERDRFSGVGNLDGESISGEGADDGFGTRWELTEFETLEKGADLCLTTGEFGGGGYGGSVEEGEGVGEHAVGCERDIRREVTACKKMNKSTE